MTSYHDIPALSASGINKWWNESPYHYWMESPFNPNRIKQETTPAMAFGSLCHILAFEPQNFDNLMAIAPDCDKRSNANKEIHADFEAGLNGRAAITRKQHEQGLLMQAALQKNLVTSKLLKDCVVEEPFFWNDLLPRKAKLDAFKDGLILDLKTGANIDWNNLDGYICKMGYYRQAAYYREAYRQRHGVFPDGFVFIFQDSDFPEIIAAKAIADIAIDVGLAECEEAASDIKRRLDAGDWLPPLKITDVTLPEWKIRQFQMKEQNV